MFHMLHMRLRHHSHLTVKYKPLNQLELPLYSSSAKILQHIYCASADSPSTSSSYGPLYLYTYASSVGGFALNKRPRRSSAQREHRTVSICKGQIVAGHLQIGSESMCSKCLSSHFVPAAASSRRLCL